MDATQIKKTLLSYVNDDVVVAPYGHGHLVTTPLRFYDDDRVTLFVEAYEDGVRVSDQGTTAMRLHMADVKLEASRIAEVWRRCTATLAPHTLAGEDGILTAWGTEGELGRLLIAVAESALRVDQLRWLSTEHRPLMFRDRLVKKIIDVAGDPKQVTPRTPLRQTSGRTRQVTAAVGDDPDSRVYVQAVSLSDQERSVEHCFYVFNHADISRQRVLAVAAGSQKNWSQELITELETVTDVAFFDDSGQVRKALSSRLAALR
jgi:hypothetical protein